MGMIVSPLTQGLRYRVACVMIDALRGLHFHIVNPEQSWGNTKVRSLAERVRLQSTTIRYDGRV